MVNLEDKKYFIGLVRKEYGIDRTFITRQEILLIRDKYKLGRQDWIKEYRIGRGKYELPVEMFMAEHIENNTKESKSALGLIPNPNPTFVPFGAYNDVFDILKSNVFFPIFITGPTRSGKTEMVIQACAVSKRNFYRVNITAETNEADLLGGQRLVDGNTKWVDGPVITAMEDESGGVLLLDEIDLGTNKIMCLQPIYEGNGVFLKREKRWVYPKPGFTIIATANTKGRGSEDGRYIGTNVMNDALLERLSGATFEQGYPDMKTEIKILNNNLKRLGIADSDFTEPLCQWADNIRKTYEAGGVDEVITTGRLLHIIKAYSIFQRNRLKAIKLALARFDTNTQVAFIDMYTKIDPNAKDESDIQPTVSNTTSRPVLRPW